MNRKRRPYRLLLALGLAGLASGCLYDPPVYDSAAGYTAAPYGDGYVYDYSDFYSYDYGYCGYTWCSTYWDGWPYWGWGGYWGAGYWGGGWGGGGYWHHHPTFSSGTTGPGPWNAGWLTHSPGAQVGPGRFATYARSGFAGGRRGGMGGFRGGGSHGGGFHGGGHR